MTITNDVTIRIHYRLADGSIEDAVQDYGLEHFGGILPSIGDVILEPGVAAGLDRRAPENRTIWTVVGRGFNPRDNHDYVALVVETRTGTAKDAWLIG